MTTMILSLQLSFKLSLAALLVTVTVHTHLMLGSLLKVASRSFG